MFQELALSSASSPTQAKEITMDTKLLVDQLSPLLLQALGIIGTALLAWIGAAIQSRTNAVKESINRDALHKALMTGAEAALAVSPTANVKVLAEEARDYAASSVPDALKALAPSSTVLAQLSVAKAAQAMSGQQKLVVSKPL
jgi:hypothetical protein